MAIKRGSTSSGTCGTVDGVGALTEESGVEAGTVDGVGFSEGGGVETGTVDGVDFPEGGGAETVDGVSTLTSEAGGAIRNRDGGRGSRRSNNLLISRH